MSILQDQLLVFIDLCISPIGLIFQSAFLIIISFTSLSLCSSTKHQIHKKDLKRAKTTFTSVILLNLLILLQHLLPLPFSESLEAALQQAVWSLNLILVGWLWIKPSQQPQFVLFQKVFILTTIGLFLLHSAQAIEYLLGNSQTTIPYTLIWKIFHYIVCIFLFFAYLQHKGKTLWASALFVILHVLSLDINHFFIIPFTFAQGFFQLIAFLLSSQIFLVLALDKTELKRHTHSTPLILSENFAAIPDSGLVQAWLQSNLHDQYAIPPYSLCKALAKTFHADACLIIQILESKTAIKVVCGFTLKKDVQISPRTVALPEEIVIQKRSVLYHEPDPFPAWLKLTMLKVNLSHSRSAWYIPLKIGTERMYMLFLSQNLYWDDEHILYFKGLIPHVVQILHNFLSEEPAPLPAPKSAPSSNPFLDLMQSEIDYHKDITQVEEELKLALQEYNRIRKILEERGIGQQL